MTKNFGEKNGFWKGGRTLASSGYWLVRVGLDHPLADCRGYAYEHRIVASEKYGRIIKKHEHVHHINGDKQDNRPENLEVLDSKNHRAKHRRGGKKRLRNPDEPNELVYCKCKCGGQLLQFDESGRYRVFIHGHNAAKRNSNE